MFEWLKRKSSEQPSIPRHLEVLGALIKGNELAENLLRMGRDEEAINQLRMMALPAAKALRQHKEAFNSLVNLTSLLIQTRQIDLAKEVVSSVQEVARLAGGNAITVAQNLAITVEGESQNASTEVGHEASSVSLVYACQRCGSLNCFLTEPCLNCAFLAKDDDAVRFGMLLSSAYLKIAYLLEIGQKISSGARPEVTLPDFKAHVANVPLEQVKSLTEVISQKKYNSRRYPTVPSLSTCPDCSKSIQLSSDETCHACTQPLQLPPIQRFIIATARTVHSIQHMLALQNSSAFGRLVCLLVAFEARAFEGGRPPARDERLDALSTMEELKYLDTQDGAMRVIFTSNGIEIGANQACKTHQFSQADRMSLFGEWIALDKHLRDGVALR